MRSTVLSKFIAKILFILLILIPFLAFPAVSLARSATTIYVDGTRPDDSGDGLSWATAKKTLDGARTTADTPGDTIELSGGTKESGGQTYSVTGPFTAPDLTITGSAATGYNGTVTINNTGSTRSFVVDLNPGSGIQTLKNVTIADVLDTPSIPDLKLEKPNIVIKNVILDYTNYNGAARGLTAVTISSGANGAYFENFVIKGFGVIGKAIVMGTDGTATFNNVTIDGSSGSVVYFTAASTVNFTNCAITNNGNLTYALFNGSSTGGVVNTTNCLIQGPYGKPHVMLSGNASIWNSTNDIINGFPYYSKTKANTGSVTFFTDDLYNIDYFTSIANYAMNTYKIPLTLYVDEKVGGASLNNTYTTKLKALCAAGHEIGAHTTDHTSLQYTNAFTVKYKGANGNMSFAVSNDGTILNVNGSGDSHLNINLTNYTITGLVSLINGWPNFSAEKLSEKIDPQNSVPATTLKSASIVLIQNQAVNIPFDDDAGPNNRYYKREITDNISDIQNALSGAGGACGDGTSYTVKTLAFPDNEAIGAVLAWIRTNVPQLVGVRHSKAECDGKTTFEAADQTWLGHLNLFWAYEDLYSKDARGITSTFTLSDYNSLSDAQKQQRMQQAARVMATNASNGFYIGLLNHNARTDLSVTDFESFLDELIKYKSQYHLTIDTFAGVVNNIRASGSGWTYNAKTGFANRTFSDSDDLRPMPNSPLINAGVVVPGRTTDILGNPIVGAPDIGAYEL